MTSEKFSRLQVRMMFLQVMWHDNNQITIRDGFHFSVAFYRIEIEAVNKNFRTT